MSTNPDIFDQFAQGVNPYETQQGGAETSQAQNSSRDIFDQFAQGVNPYIDKSSLKLGKIPKFQETDQGRDYGYGLRKDNTHKGLGYYGPIKMKNGSENDFGEISRTSKIDGKEVLYPLVVPGLTKKELDFLGKGKWAQGEKIPESIEKKALDFAKQRIKEGKPFFATTEEEGKTLLPKQEEDKNTEEEDFWTTTTRFLAQGVKGLAHKVTKGIPELLQIAGVGEALAELPELEERLPRLKKLFPFANFPEKIDREKYLEATQKASETFPTIGNISRIIEEQTGLPLGAKTPMQKLVEMGTMAAALKGGNPLEYGKAAAKTMSMASSLQSVFGGDEDAANMLGLLYGLFKKELPGFKFPKVKAKNLTPSSKKPPTIPPAGGISKAKEIIEDVVSNPYFKDLIPEHEMLDKLTPQLENSIAKQIKEVGNKPTFKFGVKPEAPKPTKTSEFSLERNIGDIIAPSKAPTPTMASKASQNEINSLSTAEHNSISADYNKVLPANRKVSVERPNMVKELQELIKENSEAGVPSTVQREINKIAKEYIKLGTNKVTGKYKKIPNSRLISQITSNNQKINHDFLQGRPSNSFINLNKILGRSIEETASIAPEAVGMYNQARNRYRNWAQEFGNKDIIKWRDPSEKSFLKMYKSTENPDQINILSDILNKSTKGKNILSRLKRGYIEKSFRPYIKDPMKTGSLEFNDTMKEIHPITTPDQRDAIRYTFESAKKPYVDFERQKIKYETLKNNHIEQVSNYKNELKNWKESINKIKKDFPYKSDKSILSELNSVRGIKRIESNIPKTTEGKQLIKEIKVHSAVNLLTQGKIIPDSSPQSLKKILNDINKRSLLEYTLGKGDTAKLVKIVNNIPKIDKHMSIMNKGEGVIEAVKRGLKVVKTAGKFIPGIRGHVATGEALTDLYKAFRSAAVEANYDTADLNVIKGIIENSERL